jgi:short-subunit dehydrogenase
MKKAIVIGATSGIGKGLAQKLTANGYQVGITGRRVELLHALKNENPDAYIVQQMDVTDLNLLENQLASLCSRLGALDLLVISSGTGELNETLDFSIEKRTIDTNVLGFTCIADWAFNVFTAQGSGHLVAITSIAGIRGSRQAPSYNATKAFQINYLEGLRQKATHTKQPIYITDLRPGFVDTDMAKGDGLFWVAPVDKAVNQIYDAIVAKKKVAYITKRWRLIGLLLSLLPRFMYDRM